jgi:uncharacterized phage-associated protein
MDKRISESLPTSNNMITFQFEKDKFFTVMQVLCEKAPDLDILKAAKLLYFLDRVHILKHGRPILGDKYICMKNGPVPSAAYDYLDDIMSDKPVDSRLSLDRGRLSPGKFPIFITSVKPDEDVLSQVEHETIKNVLSEYGNLTAFELVDLSHKHQAWKKSEKNRPIDYSLFFAEDREACKDAYDIMVIEQEDRDFVEDI